jgi:SWI/SNF-related matrix-associated actin-dependent regulator of chromatin subfamily A member 5
MMIKKPSLIIVPLTTLHNWRREVECTYPSAKIKILRCIKEEREDLLKELKKDIDQYDLIITSYESVLIMNYFLSKIDWEYIVIDEAHKLKNNESIFAEKL